MQLTLSAIAFIAIVSLAIFILKTRAEGQRRAIVGLIFLSTSSVAIALALNSLLIFFAAQLILLLMAISLALREHKEQRKKG
ncbi:hypothetical protein [Bacillus sp. ISL-39]|uniref:hypothetical protein n=1 Tax=Bacillus sp. ISL-39 TaxID=2819124 RepID=UPI001BE8248F|nr:hypothetical protein [Bacillus sp. ISL-39]MBT2636818.1 hypothetical protein [Bacillus sp. ISL-39]